jgi:predicted GNAT family acetyltransferase
MLVDAPVTTALDNPIWHALSTVQAGFGRGTLSAKSFFPLIGPLSGIPDQSPASYAALAEVVQPGGVVALFLESDPAFPSSWSSVHADVMYQMIGDEPLRLAPPGEFRELGSTDVPQMISLAELTEPGPFLQRTRELGRFVGSFHEGQLAAMAGERLQLKGLREVSAVCTHPDHRGRGYARALMSEIIRGIVDRGETPFLHVRHRNVNAIALYENMGFRIRRKLNLAVLRYEAQPDSDSAR